MGFRFHRRIRILPGIHLNLSKSGVGLSLGAPPFTVSIGPRGVRETASLPGAGISYVSEQSAPARPERARGGHWLLWALVLAVAFLALAGRGHAGVYARPRTVTAVPFQFAPVTVYRGQNGRSLGTATTFSSGVTIYRSR